LRPKNEHHQVRPRRRLQPAFNQRAVEFKTTLGGDSIDHYYEAFEAFLLAVGFVQDSIDRRYE